MTDVAHTPVVDTTTHELHPDADQPVQLTAADVVRLAVTLPPWNARLDDDPNWLRPVAAAGLTRLEVEGDALTAYEAAKEAVAADRLPLVQVPTDLIRYTGQPWLRIDALAHYLEDEPRRQTRWPGYHTGARKLFDPDGWFGTDHPVLFWHRDGYFVMDGNNRCAADRLAGRPTTTAHALGGPATP